jgi:methenyltetrahydromethanopterin cyclohydrolase
MKDLNRRALERIRRLLVDPWRFGVRVERLRSGAQLIDLGVQVSGGLEAGLALAEACMGGLGRAELRTFEVAGARWDTPPRGTRPSPVDFVGTPWWPAVQVATDHPALCCMASQYAGWSIQVSGYRAMGSGPLRAVARVERELFDRLGYGERSTVGVICLESSQLPTDEVAEYLASVSGIPPDALYLLVAPTGSLAGSVQIAARSVETALHRMMTSGFDVRRVRWGFGTAPLAPPTPKTLEAIGRTNDAILYGSRVWLGVDASDEELGALAPELVASASPAWGSPFRRLLEDVGGDFYRLDPRLFSPAEVTLTSLRTGRTHRAGSIAPDVLRTSLHGQHPAGS